MENQKEKPREPQLYMLCVKEAANCDVNAPKKMLRREEKQTKNCNYLRKLK